MRDGGGGAKKRIFTRSSRSSHAAYTTTARTALLPFTRRSDRCAAPVRGTQKGGERGRSSFLHVLLPLSFSPLPLSPFTSPRLSICSSLWPTHLPLSLFPISLVRSLSRPSSSSSSSLAPSLSGCIPERRWGAWESGDRGQIICIITHHEGREEGERPWITRKVGMG